MRAIWIRDKICDFHENTGKEKGKEKKKEGSKEYHHKSDAVR
jgi:hypothetical protein